MRSSRSLLTVLALLFLIGAGGTGMSRTCRALEQTRYHHDPNNGAIDDSNSTGAPDESGVDSDDDVATAEILVFGPLPAVPRHFNFPARLGPASLSIETGPNANSLVDESGKVPGSESADLGTNPKSPGDHPGVDPTSGNPPVPQDSGTGGKGTIGSPAENGA